MLQEEFLWRVNREQVVDEVIIRRAPDLVAPQLVEGLPSEGYGRVRAPLCHGIHHCNDFNILNTLPRSGMIKDPGSPEVGTGALAHSPWLLGRDLARSDALTLDYGREPSNRPHG